MGNDNDINKKITCKHCNHKNIHVFIHAFGLCENCGKQIKQCEHCGYPIPNGGKQAWRNLWVQFRLLEEVLRKKLSELG